MADPDAPYEVGYGKPPRATQFTKGASGNPRGRPKGSKNLAKVVLAESRQKVRINGPHGTRTVTKLEAAMMQIGNKSAQGDLRAAREMFALVQRSEEAMTSNGGPLRLSELDQPVLESIQRRMLRTDGDNPEQEKK